MAAWEHLSITKPHLVYIILGGFTSLFMLCSSVIKERLYIGEATVATICGIIFGPHAADLINPRSWGNEDLITLEFSRIVLVVQCFAVGVELPKAYMERHWKSVTLLLLPVMTYGWLITSLFIWWVCPKLNWLDSLCVAACVTATDPVLASSIVGKGKFAKRVPKHLRDLLSAESGCNDGMAFPFVYLSLYLLRYRPDATEVFYHWFCYTILYECIFGAFYGVVIGYLARRAIRYAHERDLIDRESFLVFYFVLALFCAGSGSLLGMDDLLVGFACGVGFSNDGWFLEKTEESHVSNVIDLLINLAFFVYFGTIIPWEQYNSAVLGLAPWRLVVIAVFVIFFRRIPIMLVLKPIIPDLKSWREALFAGHFGPIGVGAIFVAILARAELETEGTTPLGKLPEEGFEHLNIIELIWPITTFLVITSILVHGSSIAVFTLGKHINTLTLTLSYTQAAEEGPSWMDRLPRIQSRSKTSMSLRRPSEPNSIDDKHTFPPGTLAPTGIPGNFLRRQREEEGGSRPTSRPTSRPSSIRALSRKKRWDQGRGPGGPISQSAIAPQRASDMESPGHVPSGTETMAANDDSGESSLEKRHENASEDQGEVFQEGDKLVVEDQGGDVLGIERLEDVEGRTEDETRRNFQQDVKAMMKEHDVQHGHAQKPEDQRPHHGARPTPDVAPPAERHGRHWRDMRKRMQSFSGASRGEESASTKPEQPPPEPKRGPAYAYQFGHTIIVEDEAGEVIKKYDIPVADRPPRTATQRKPSVAGDGSTLGRIQRMGSYFGRHHEPVAVAGPSSTVGDGNAPPPKSREESDDDRIRFTIGPDGRRFSKAEFIKQVQQLAPRARDQTIDQVDAPDSVKEQVHEDVRKASERMEGVPSNESVDHGESERGRKRVGRGKSPIRVPGTDNDDDGDSDVPMHDVRQDLARFSMGRETAAQKRRRLASGSPSADAKGGESSSSRSAEHEESPGAPPSSSRAQGKKPEYQSKLDQGETPAERRRREAALGMTQADSDSDSDEGGPAGMRTLPADRSGASSTTGARIRFADQAVAALTGHSPVPASTPAGGSSPEASMTASGRLRWGDDVGRKERGRG